MKTYSLLIKQCQFSASDVGKSTDLLDIGISQCGTISALEKDIDETEADQVIDAAGNFVSPGLIDLHTHVYWGATYWGIEADPLAAKTGVTTWVDAGSAGAYNFPGFRRFIVEKSSCRIFSFLNIAGTGLTARTGELALVNEVADVELAIKTIDCNRDVIKGIKIRLDRDATQETGLEGMKRARMVADATELPIMVHIGIAPPALCDIAQYLRAGDILTHCYTGHSNRLVDNEYVPLPLTKHLRSKGVVFDLGHGTGSFNFDVAEALMKHGYAPDVISSDVHQVSRQSVMFDLPHTMSKMLCLGMPLADIIERVTEAPAKVLREPNLAELQIGCQADLAIWKIEDGEFTFVDSSNNTRTGSQSFVNVATVMNGKLLSDMNEKPCHPWVVADHLKVAGLNENVATSKT